MSDRLETEEVRHAYAELVTRHKDVTYAQEVQEFDEWLERVKFQARAEGYAKGWDHAWNPPGEHEDW